MPHIRVTDIDRRELVRLRNKVDGMRGPGVVNTHNAIAINGGGDAGRRSVNGFSLPPGLKYQCLMVVDDMNTWAPDWPRIHQ